MKKLISIILSLEIVLALAGCGGAETPEPAPSESEVQGQRTETDEELEVIKASNSYGLYTVEYVADSLQTRAPEVHYQQIFYTDFKSAVKKPLCGIENCAHSDLSCMSWLESYLNDNKLYATDEMLVLINPNKSSYVRGADGRIVVQNEVPARIELLDLDGSNRRTLFTLDAERIFYRRGIARNMDSGVYCDGSYLYINTARLDDCVGDQLPSDTEMLKIDLETGNVADRFTLAGDYHIGGIYNVAGVYDNRMVALKQISSGYDGVASGLPAEPEKEIWQYNLISPLDGSVTELFTYSDADYSVMYFSEEYILCGKDGAISSLDPKTGALEKIADIPKDWQGFQPWDVYDGHMTIYVTHNDGSYNHHYALDFERGEFYPFTLNWFAGEKTELRISEILATADDEYLVAASSEWYADNEIGTGGVPITVERDHIKYAMISKEDYWNCVPNYRDITEAK